MKRIERNRIGLLIHDVSRLRRTAFDHLMKPLDVTRSQWWVLNGLSAHGNNGITQTALAQLLDLGKVALGGIVDRLEDRGLVERRADAKDRRINRVFLTRKGSRILARVSKLGMTMDARVMRGISATRRQLLADLLHVMKTNLIALDAVPGSRPRLEDSRAPQRPAESAPVSGRLLNQRPRLLQVRDVDHFPVEPHRAGAGRRLECRHHAARVLDFLGGGHVALVDRRDLRRMDGEPAGEPFGPRRARGRAQSFLVAKIRIQGVDRLRLPRRARPSA